MLKTATGGLGLLVATLCVFGWAASAGASFGFQEFGNAAINPDETADTVAGSHPWEMITKFQVNEAVSPLTGETEPDGNIKDAYVGLPPGVVGNASATPKCTSKEFHEEGANSTIFSGANCREDTQVGIAELLTIAGFPFKLHFGIYNLVPDGDLPAEFGFNPVGAPVLLTPSLRTGEDYGVTVASKNTNQTLDLFNVTTMFWGVPADPSHDELRGRCMGLIGESECKHPSELQPRPLLSLPTQCSGKRLETSLIADSWQNPGTLTPFGLPEPADANWISPPAAVWPALTGCEELDFSPKIGFAAEESAPNTPTGLTTELKIPQNEDPIGLREADLKRAEVTLPLGYAVSPSAAGGRLACTPEEIGLKNPGTPSCPEASKVGVVELHTPLLEQPLEGALYLAQQESVGECPAGGRRKGPCLLALYLVAAGSGILIKEPGEVRLNEETGQITTIFDNNPQQPFDALKLQFFGGAHAAVATPPACGTYDAVSRLTPWSSEVPVVSESPLPITSNCGIGFAPSFTAGTTVNQAAGFSPFSVTLSRTDQDQFLGKLSVTMPPGLLGMLSQVPLCGEPQAARGECGGGSEIGSVTVGAGPGSDPVWVTGHAYLTGPPSGALSGDPFGLSIVVPVQAGPFDLGLEKVHAGIRVDPHTAQITIESETLPHIVRGIPLQIRTIHVEADRSGFIFNPTNCEPLSVAGTVGSLQGASVAVSSHFQAANCAALAFTPKFTVFSQAATSHARGASLDVKVAYPKAGEANIKGVKVSLPKQLPSRLTTIQKACPEATFAANPASCPEGSNIGTATAITPVLNVPLTGPAYLVSHGGAAFPDLDIVLQGQGVTLDLTGAIDIKGAITSSTFSTVPDTPISSFELKLPEGPHSGLAAHLAKKAHNLLCGSKLVMPTTITGQNGAVIDQSTKVAITGCPKKKAKPHKHAKHKKHGKGKKH